MDQELVAFLSQQFADLRGEMDKRFGETAQQFADLRGEMDKGFADLRGEMDKGFADLRGEMDSRFTDLRGEMDSRFGKVDEELRTVKEEARLAHVVLEGQHGDIRLVAEGFAAANEKTDAVRAEFKEEIGEVKSLLRPSYRDLDRRVKVLESSRKRAGRVAAAKD